MFKAERCLLTNLAQRLILTVIFANHYPRHREVRDFLESRFTFQLKIIKTGLEFSNFALERFRLFDFPLGAELFLLRPHLFNLRSRLTPAIIHGQKIVHNLRIVVPVFY